MSTKLLITGGTVLSLDRSLGNLTEADVLIEDGRITEVGASLRARNAETVDASNAIVMPGFVDVHRHVWHTLLRNAGAGMVSPAQVGPHYTADHVYAATLAGLLGAVAAGITSLVDWADLGTEPTVVEAALQAHQDAGLRTVYVAAQAPWTDAAHDPASLDAVVGLDRGDNVDIAFGAPDPGRDHAATRGGWQVARSAGLRIHAHVGTDAASAGVVAGLGEAGVLGEDVTLVHCTNLDGRDLDAVAASGAGVALTPSMEMTAGMGSPPLQALIDRGIRPGLGVGSEMEAPGDLFAQMRAGNSVQHATLFDLKLAGKGGVPNLLTTRDVIRYATVDGARTVGLGDIAGTLTPGKAADVLVLRTDTPNIAPVNDPIGAVVWGMDTSNVDWVFVGGRALVREGELDTDVARVRELATTAHQQVAVAAGLFADTETQQR